MSHTLTRTRTRVHTPTHSQGIAGAYLRGSEPSVSARIAAQASAAPPLPAPSCICSTSAWRPGPQTAICSCAGGCVRQALRRRVQECAPRTLQPLPVAVTSLLRASVGTRPARAPRCRPDRPSSSSRPPGPPPGRSPTARRPHRYLEPGRGRAASPWPPPAGGTAPAKRRTG